MSIGGIYNPYGYVSTNNVTYSPTDKIRVTDIINANYGMVGTILRYDKDDDSYLIEFEYDTPWGASKHTEWYFGTSSFVHSDKPSPGCTPPSSKSGTHCYHEWYEDSYFTSKKYKTCRKCGKKHEDL